MFGEWVYAFYQNNIKKKDKSVNDKRKQKITKPEEEESKDNMEEVVTEAQADENNPTVPTSQPIQAGMLPVLLKQQTREVLRTANPEEGSGSRSRSPKPTPHA